MKRSCILFTLNDVLFGSVNREGSDRALTCDAKKSKAPVIDSSVHYLAPISLVPNVSGHTGPENIYHPASQHLNNDTTHSLLGDTTRTREISARPNPGHRRTSTEFCCTL